MDTKIIQNTIAKTMEEMPDLTPQCEIFAHLLSANLIRLVINSGKAVEKAPAKLKNKTNKPGEHTYTRKEINLICTDCSSPYTGYSKNSKRCPECKEKRRIENTQHAYAKKLAKNEAVSVSVDETLA